MRQHVRPRVVGGLGGVAAVAVACGIFATAPAAMAASSTPGYNPKTHTFTVAALEPLSGPIAAAGESEIGGMRLYFDSVNKAGGLDGKYKINFTPEDSQFNTQVAVPIFNRIAPNTAIFSGILGTEILNALLPSLKSNNLLTVPDSSSAPLIYQSNFLPWGTSAQVNAINEVGYAANKLDMKSGTYCAMVGPDSNGADSLQGVQYAVKAMGLKYGTTIQPSYATTDFTPYIQQLQSAGCTVIFDGMITSNTPGIMGAAAQASYNAEWLGQNNVWVPAFAKTPVAPYMQQHFLTALTGGAWNSKTKGMEMLQAAIKKFAPSTAPDPYLEEGFTHGMLIGGILEKAIASGNFTRAGIMKAAQSIGTFNYQGLLPNYTYGPPAKRKAPTTTSIWKVDPSQALGVALAANQYSVPAAASYKAPTSA